MKSVLTYPSCTQGIFRNKNSLTFVLGVLSCFIDNPYGRNTSVSGLKNSSMTMLFIALATAPGILVIITSRGLVSSKGTKIARANEPYEVEDLILENPIERQSVNNEWDEGAISNSDEGSSTTLSSTLSLNVTKLISSNENAKQYDKQYDKPSLSVLITVDNKTFNLSTETGKAEWKEHVSKNSRPQVEALFTEEDNKPEKFNATLSVPSLRTPTEVKLDINPMNDLVNQKQATRSANLKKARDDINIHDPNQPVPSVLDYQVVDKKGRPLRRIFIPGRGWVSRKVLESERTALGLTPNPKPLVYS